MNKSIRIHRIYSQGNLRGEKVLYKDGIGCCVWYPLLSHLPPRSSEDAEDSGLCFDFSYSDIDDFISLLETLKEIEPEVYEEIRDDN